MQFIADPLGLFVETPRDFTLYDICDERLKVEIRKNTSFNTHEWTIITKSRNISWDIIYNTRNNHSYKWNWREVPYNPNVSVIHIVKTLKECPWEFSSIEGDIRLKIDIIGAKLHRDMITKLLSWRKVSNSQRNNR